jgi:Cys-rich repeat protein
MGIVAVLVTTVGLAGCDFFPSDSGPSLDADVTQNVCVMDSDCDSGYCDLDSQTCVECLKNLHCPSGRYCHPDTFQCVACFTDAHCAAGVCDETVGLCKECTENNHCASGTCDVEGGVCLKCGSDSDCASTNPCTLAVCIEGECSSLPAEAGTLCSDGDPCTAGDSCADGLCIPGDVIPGCEEPLDTCHGAPDGMFCNDNNPCTLDDVCLDGKCIGTSIDPACFQDDLDGDGFTVADGDCDDQDATIHPEAMEFCDGRDNNCNGIVDEGCDTTCVISGCSGEICATEPLDSICIWLPEFECLPFSKCGPYGLGGSCGWLQTPGYLQCLADIGIPCGENAACPPGMFCSAAGICEPDPMLPCATDADCPDGQSCVAGLCVTTNPPCASNADCPAGFVCMFGQCVPNTPPCASNPDCPAGFACVNGQCVHVPPPCLTDADCNDGDPCTKDKCTPSSGCTHVNICGGCQNDSQCPTGQVCDPATGTCVPSSGGCTTNAQCGAGKYCFKATCNQNTGTCTAVPQACALYYDPVCGCNGTTYGNLCLLMSAKQNLKHMGACNVTPIDADGDGFTIGQGDCNDQDASIHPMAPELCDGIDNNCSGIVDEGCPGAPCVAHSDCPAGFSCVNGVCQTQSACMDLSDVDFGMCEMIIGWGFANGSCTWLSGCGCGNYCQYVFDSQEKCEEACGIPSNECEAAGGVCAYNQFPWMSVYPQCPAGTSQIDVGGCPNNTDGFGICCMPAGCSSDVECAAEEICMNGMCVPWIDPGCQTDADCDPGFVCMDGFCTPWGDPNFCMSSQDCAATQYCYRDACNANHGVCVTPPQACYMLWAPVCGCDNVTYSNHCFLLAAGQDFDYLGECQEEPQPACKDLSNIDFGMCAMIIGWGYVNGGCTWLSGCGCGEYCEFVFDTQEKCEDACGIVTNDGEICGDGIDNNGNGLVDEGCGPIPCTSNADCPVGPDGTPLVCQNGLCVPSTNPGYCWDSSQCLFGSYCYYKDCAVETGACVQIPGACPMVWAPVCSCSNQTYGNLCELQAAQEHLKHMGQCQTSSACKDLSNIDFGPCLAFFGWGWVNGQCQMISGCGCGNYCQDVYSSHEDCKQQCAQ